MLSPPGRDCHRAGGYAEPGARWAAPEGTTGDSVAPSARVEGTKQQRVTIVPAQPIPVHGWFLFPSGRTQRVKSLGIKGLTHSLRWLLFACQDETEHVRNGKRGWDFMGG